MGYSNIISVIICLISKCFVSSISFEWSATKRIQSSSLFLSDVFDAQHSDSSKEDVSDMILAMFFAFVSRFIHSRSFA